MARVTSHIRSVLAAATIALGAGVAIAQGPPGTAAATTRISAAAGVTIKVTPVAKMGGEWLFAVVMEAEAASLDGKLEAQSVLVADKEELKARQWDGSGPGGQRREGILTFPVPQGEAKAVEIRIRRDGESAARVFRWESGDL